jgi:hypothetical protein
MLRHSATWIAVVSTLFLSLVDTHGQEDAWRVFHYRMAGGVRLLLFWVGRDGVGGGSIALSSTVGPNQPTRTDVIEVLFGSDPARVPGKVNRWGCGRETASWQTDSAGKTSKLLWTSFEGFMRHSSEESLGDVRSNSSKDKQTSLFWFDAIRSAVTPGEASSTIHFFAQNEEFDYRNPVGVDCAYRQRLRGGPPDRQRSLDRRVSNEAPPHGFLTALQSLMNQVSQRYLTKDPRWSSGRPALTYFYNAKTYRLEVQDLGQPKQFTLDSGSSSDKGMPINDVIEAEFQITNLATKERHGFSIWYPASGPLRGIPLRIVDKPRWWLRVELTLDAETARNGGLIQAHGAMPGCATVVARK